MVPPEVAEAAQDIEDEGVPARLTYSPRATQVPGQLGPSSVGSEVVVELHALTEALASRGEDGVQVGDLSVYVAAGALGSLRGVVDRLGAISPDLSQRPSLYLQLGLDGGPPSAGRRLAILRVVDVVAVNGYAVLFQFQARG